MLTDALVDPFVVAAEDDEVLLQAHLVRNALIEGLPIGRSIDHLIVVALALEVGDSAVDRLDLQDHPCLTPEGIVIDTAPLIRSVVTDIVDMKLEEALLLGTADDGVLERTLEELGHDGEDIYSHVGIYLFDRVRRREGG